MKINFEFDTLFRIFCQYLTLGQTELARFTLQALHRLNNETTEQILNSLPHQLTGYDISELPSHSPSQIQWSVLNFLNQQESPLVLKSHLFVVLDSFLQSSKTNGVLRDSDWNLLQEMLEKSLSKNTAHQKENPALQTVIDRFAKELPVMIRSLSQTLTSYDLKNLVILFERSLIRIIQTTDQAEDSVFRMRCLQGPEILPLQDYFPLIQSLATSCYSTEDLTGALLESVLSIPSPKLSISLQESLEDALSQDEDFHDARVVLFGGRENPSAIQHWSTFQICRIHAWHYEGKQLETVVKELVWNKFDLLESWNPRNKRMISLVVLLGWDSLSAQNTSSTFPLKKKLLHLGFPKLSHGTTNSELSMACGSLWAKIQFSEILSNLLKQQSYGVEKESKQLEAGYLLTQLSTQSPQCLLSHYVEEFDLETSEALGKFLNSIPIEDLTIPIIRDFQLIIASGILSSILSFFSLFGKLLNGLYLLPNPDRVMPDLWRLISTIHSSLCGMQGTYLHAWLLSMINSLVNFLVRKPELLMNLFPTFKTGQKPQQHFNGEASNHSMETLKLLKEFITVLQDSTNQMTAQKANYGWEKEALDFHLSYLQTFYENIQSALDFLTVSTKLTKKILASGGWKTLGSFLTLPNHLQELLRVQLVDFIPEINSLLAWSEILEQRGVLPGTLKIKGLQNCLDVIFSKKLDLKPSIRMLKLFLYYQWSPEEDPTNGRLRKIAEKMSGLLEQLPAGESRTVNELFGTGMASLPVNFSPQSPDLRVKQILEHLKALFRLRDTVRDVENGRLGYLSGLLHNLSRALSEDISKIEFPAFVEAAGYSPDLSAGIYLSESSLVPVLSRMVDYLADVGDIITTMDDGPAEGHNYFAMLKQTPQELLASLIAHAHCAEDVENTAKVADVLQVDLVREILPIWITPVLAQEDVASLQLLPQQRIPNLQAMKALASIAPIRVLVFCALASRTQTIGHQETKERQEKELFEQSLELLLSLDETKQYSTFHNWLKMEDKENLEKQELSQFSPLGKHDQVRELLQDGSTLREALKLSGKLFPEGIPDKLLYEMVEATEKFPEDDEPNALYFTEAGKTMDSLHSVHVSYAASLKIQNPHLALQAALLRVHSWSIERAIEFYSLLLDSMEKTEAKEQTQVADFLYRLRLYQKILNSSMKDEFRHWSKVDYAYQKDSGQLIRRLLSSGAVLPALDIVQHEQETPDNLRCSVFAAYIQELSLGTSSQDKGPLQAIKFLKKLPPGEAFTVLCFLQEQDAELGESRLLIHYLLRLKGNLPEGSMEQLKQVELGISALKCLPQQWSEKCAHLVQKPALIMESLIMAKQIASVKKMIEEIPSVRDDTLLIHYARKALSLGPDKEALPYFIDLKEHNKTQTKPSLKFYSSRLSMLTDSKSTEIRSGVGLVPVKVLSSNQTEDNQRRLHCCFKSTPDLVLFRVLFDLISTDQVAALAAIRAASDLANGYLLYSHGQLEWNPVVAQQFQEVVDTCLEVLEYAESKLQGIEGSSSLPLASSSESQIQVNQDPKYFKLVTSSFTGGPQNLTLTEKILSPSNGHPGVVLRMEMELLNKILSRGIQSSLIDLRDPVHCKGLLDRLLTAEQFQLSVETAKQCSMDERPYYEAWVTASIQEGNFLIAQELLPLVFCIPSGIHMDSTRVQMESQEAAMRLVKVLEMTYPVDMPAFFNLHNSLKNSRLGRRFSASSKEILKRMNRRRTAMEENVQSIESPFTQARQSTGDKTTTKKQMIQLAASATLLEKRIKFCEELLANYAPSLLIEFMFRHGRGALACQIMFPVGLSSLESFKKTLHSSVRKRISWSEAHEAGSTSMKETVGKKETSMVSLLPGLNEEPSNRKFVEERSLSIGSSGSPDSDLCKSQSLPEPSSTGKPSTRPAPSFIERKFSEKDSNTIIKNVDKFALAQVVEDVHQLCDLSSRYHLVDEMARVMLTSGLRGQQALIEACKWFESGGQYQHLYKCQKALDLLDSAGMTCLKLSLKTTNVQTSLTFLESAKMHFQEALNLIQTSRFLQEHSSYPQLSITSSTSDLRTLIDRSALQILIYKELLLKMESKDGVNKETLSPSSCSMFTEHPENLTEEDEIRRLKIVERLLIRDFTLAFRVIFEFKIPEVVAYSNAVASMALARKHKAIIDLVNNIKNSVSEADLDQVLFHAVSAYDTQTDRPEAKDWTAWFAEGLVELMISPHAKIRALVKMGDLHSAYNLAKTQGSSSDISIIKEAAESDGRRSFVKKCDRLLRRGGSDIPSTSARI